MILYHIICIFLSFKPQKTITNSWLAISFEVITEKRILARLQPGANRLKSVEAKASLCGVPPLGLPNHDAPFPGALKEITTGSWEVLDFCGGGELFFHMLHRGRFEDSEWEKAA